MFRLTSPQNPRIKEVVRLRQGNYRRKVGRFLIDGQRETERAILGGFPVEEIFFCPDCADEETWRWIDETEKMLTKFPSSGGVPEGRGGDFPPEEGNFVKFWEVPENIFGKMAYGEREDGVLAVARTVEKTLDEIWAELPRAKAVRMAILEGVEKPGNVGAILRSADGAGISAMIVTDPGTDLFNPNTIRASMGTIFSVPICVAEAETVPAWLAEHGITLFAARVDGAIPYFEADFRQPCAVAVGSEAWGLSDVFSGEGVQAISLPMLGISDSLNVSVTAGILFYEMLRQREFVVRSL